MKLVERTTDLISGLNDTERLHTLSNFPVFMGCVDGPQSDDLLADSIWEIGASTGLIQLKKLILPHHHFLYFPTCRLNKKPEHIQCMTKSRTI